MTVVASGHARTHESTMSKGFVADGRCASLLMYFNDL